MKKKKRKPNNRPANLSANLPAKTELKIPYYEEPVDQKILNEMLECSTCTDLSKKKYTPDYSVAQIDRLMEQLPGVDYVLDRVVNYIFSNGMTTGDPMTDAKILDPWLYEAKNRRDVTNYEELRTVIRQATAYGECGLRIYEGNIYHYKRGEYGMIVSTDNGIQEVEAYFIHKKGKIVDSDLDQERFSNFESFEDMWNYFSNHDLILLSTDEFVNVRSNTAYLHGECPFTKDQQRLDLLLSVYERLNYDIDYDGPGRIIVRPKDKTTDTDASTSEILDTSGAASRRRNDKAKEEVQRIARDMKNSSSDSVILLSNAFSDKVEHLPRVTKATEFFDWISNDTVVIAQMLGMSPTLLEIGKIHGNVSVEKIIDNAMLNTIIPKRESFAVQWSKPLSDMLGVPKIYFDKYDMQQVEDENDIRAKVANMIKTISYANKANENPNTASLVDELDALLRSSLYDNTGQPRTL